MPSTYEPIATTTLGTTTNTITFSSIPNTYTDLRLVWTYLGTSSGAQPVVILNNTSLGNLYSVTDLQGNGSSASSGRGTSQNSLTLGFGVSTSTTIPSLTTFDLFNYAGSTNKTGLYTSSNDKNGSGVVSRGVTLMRTTNAINRIDIYLAGADQATGTTATLYGILKA